MRDLEVFRENSKLLRAGNGRGRRLEATNRSFVKAAVAHIALASDDTSPRSFRQNRDENLALSILNKTCNHPFGLPGAIRNRAADDGSSFEPTLGFVNTR